MSILHRGKYGIQLPEGASHARADRRFAPVGPEIAFACAALAAAFLLGSALHILGMEGQAAIPHFVLVNLCALTLLIVAGLSWFRHDDLGSSESDLLHRLASLFALAGLETLVILSIVDAPIVGWWALITGTLALSVFFALLTLATLSWSDGTRAVLWIAAGAGFLVLGQFALENSSVARLWPTEAFVALMRYSGDAASLGTLIYGLATSLMWVAGAGVWVARGLGMIRSPL